MIPSSLPPPLCIRPVPLVPQPNPRKPVLKIFQSLRSAVRGRGSLVACLASVCFAAGAITGRAQTLDSVVFGQPTSEGAHALAPAFGPVTPPSYVTAGAGVNPSEPSATGPSDVVTGALGQTARRLLPRTPNPDVYGGEVAFTMAVDPVKQNYFSLKLWGSDPNSGATWLILNLNGLEVGGRHGSDGQPLWFQPVSWTPGQFVYRTLPLPLHLTRGRTSVALKIRSFGWISYYDSGAWFGKYNKLMKQPSLSLYRAYTHVGSILDTAGEAQNPAPVLITPRAIETEATALTKVKKNVNDALAKALNAASATIIPDDLRHIARCYDAKENLGQSWIVYPGGMTAAAALAKLVDGIDAQVVKSSADANYAGNDWGGRFGPIGEAIYLLWPQLSTGATMTTPVAYAGNYGTVTRTIGWSRALRASLDGGRFARRTIANQAMTGDFNVYMTNRGLLLVDPANALNETEALRYVKEACGLLPWLGSDRGGGTLQVPNRGLGPNGPDWFMVTSKATTKDGNGFVGSDYGEQGAFVFRMGAITNDAQLKTRGIEITRSRVIFRFPGRDSEGYLTMQGAESIGVRNSGLPGHEYYLSRLDHDLFFLASQGAAVIGADLIGAFQQAVNEGQLFQQMNDVDDPYAPMRYATIKAMPPTNVKMRMSIGAPDFAWADEENMVVAAKHDEERLFTNLFWAQPDTINGAAKILHLSAAGPRLADVQVEDVRYKATGKSVVHDGMIEMWAWDVPPEKPVNALVGLIQPVAMRSDLSTPPTGNKDGGRGTGYTLRYGHWLIGMNAHYTDTYQMLLPANFTSATDLISGTVKTGPVILAAKTTVVFYLPDIADASPVPASPLLINAYSRNNAVLLTWSPSAAADSYTLKRATTPGGPYTTLAAGLATLGYRDGTAVNGTTYYYVLSATSAGGTGGDSVETSVTPGSIQLKGTIVGTPGQYGADTDFSAAAALDDDLATYFSAPTNTGDWVGYDLDMGLGGAQALAQIKYCPRPTYPTRMVGGSFQGANLADFSDAVTLATITFAPASNALTTVVIANPAPFKYVRYKGAAGVSADIAEVQFFASAATTPTPAAPATAPAGLSATAGYGSVFLSFTAVPNASAYQIKRSTSIVGVTTTLATTDQTWFYDTAVANGTTYFYTVTPLNLGGTGPTSAQVSATPGGLPPGAPSGLTAALTSTSGTITLSWNASAGLVTYKVRRATFPGGPYSLLATGISDAAYGDTTALNGITYYYVVSAVNALGESGNSNEASQIKRTSSQVTGAVIGTAGSYNNGGNTIAKAFDGDLSTYFDGPTGNGCWAGLDLGTARTITQASYCPRLNFGSRMLGGVFQGANTANFSDAVTLATISATPANSTFASLTINNPTAFRYVRYLSPNASSGDVAELQFLAFDLPPLPPAPTGLTATGGDARVSLAWDDGVGNGYNVKRALNAGGPYTPIATGLTTPGYTDLGRAPGTTYYYVVTLTTALSESPVSAEASATTYTALEAWRWQNFGAITPAGTAADGGDPDGDGLSNLVEYATGGNPTSATSAPRPLVEILQQGSDRFLSITFQCIADPSLTYTVEASDDLTAGSWTAIWSSTGAANVAGPVTVKDVEPLTANPRRFLRLSVSIQAEAALPNHPGAVLTQSDLDRVRANLAANREPWASAWLAVKSSGPGPTWTSGATGVITDSYTLQNQGHSIWQLTVKWVGSGDIAYANAAKKAIDQWVNNVTGMTTTTIRTGIGAMQMANAAEILAHGFGGSAGWPAANVAKAKAWFKRVPYKVVSAGAGQRTGNWGTSALAGCMSMAIFCDDQVMFDYAVAAYKLGFRDTTDGNCGVTQYIDATGEAMETGRDRGHVQGGMAHLVEVALMAWNQNVNIVTYNDNQCTTGVNGPYGVSGANRLLLGLEYEAKYNLGGTVSYHPFLTNWGQVYYPNGISPRAGWSPMWEMVNHLFALSGMNQVYSPQVLSVAGYAPEPSNGDHVGYGTLLFR